MDARLRAFAPLAAGVLVAIVVALAGSGIVEAVTVGALVTVVAQLVTRRLVGAASVGRESDDAGR